MGNIVERYDAAKNIMDDLRLAKSSIEDSEHVIKNDVLPCINEAIEIVAVELADLTEQLQGMAIEERMRLYNEFERDNMPPQNR